MPSKDSTQLSSEVASLAAASSPSIDLSTAPPPDNDPAILAHLANVHIDRLIAHSPIYAFLLSRASFICAKRGAFRARLALGPEHLNSRGSLHGSVSATVVDWAGGLAVASWDGRFRTGVSTDIHVSYLGGAREGEVVEVEAVAQKVGGSMAFTTVEVWAVEGAQRKRLVVSGRHTKFLKEPGQRAEGSGQGAGRS
ncbi:HotDog domain-containing protein [Lineolata rhizophorae]|uniref:HotDog domain-containing protein n=1 Tax=Lineolata rhizophorae TaxID=578093 RepID=A0A6A6P164_9PEZI|nr:HotDog domain-containing protein [Lineolata rhizophorae]